MRISGVYYTRTNFRRKNESDSPMSCISFLQVATGAHALNPEVPPYDD